MRELKFNYASAKNFICFGPDGIEIFFDDYGSLVLVKGQNYDDGTEEEPGSNGAGKSSLQDIFSYALYGKSVKKPTQLYGGKIVNTLAEKGGEVEVRFDDHRVVRTISPNKLRVWKSADRIWDKESEITRGTMTETQKYIDEIVGLTHQAFCNVIVFDDSNTHAFLEANATDKRKIAENLLSLDKYREYHESAKRKLKMAKAVVAELTKDYERLLLDMDSCKKRIKLIEGQEAEWKKGVMDALKAIMQSVKNKQAELETTDTGQAIAKYQEAQEKIVELEGSIEELEHKRSKLESIIKDARTKLEAAQTDKANVNEVMQQHHLNIRNSQAKAEESKKLIASLENLQDGQTCPTCHGTITRDNYGTVLQHESNVVSQCEAQITKETAAIEVHKHKFGEKSAIVSKLESHIAEANKAMTGLESKLHSHRQEVISLNKIQKPEGDSVQQVLETEIVELKRQFKIKKDELDNGGPYKEILENAVQEQTDKQSEIDEKIPEIKAAEDELPYYEYWVKAFGDDGIRKFVLNGAIPALNARIAYWLQHLIDNKIELTFDNQLKEKVFRNGTEAIYHSMSNGEKRRINLAVSQAFSYVMTLHSGCCPSLVFLDEITGGGIDRVGVTGVYNMIFELAKERQVLVTTHNENLLDMLQGCESITLRKKDDITVLVS